MSLQKCRRSPPCNFLHDPAVPCPVVGEKKAKKKAGKKKTPPPPKKISGDPKKNLKSEKTEPVSEIISDKALEGYREYRRLYMRRYRASKKQGVRNG